MDEEMLVDKSFRLFSKRKISKIKELPPAANQEPESQDTEQQVEKETPSGASNSSFADLGLTEWAITTCTELGMKVPTPVQEHCIPKILAGRDVLGIAHTGSGKTAAFALPILQQLAKDMFGVFALVITPTRELAYQLAEQFRALGSCLNVRVSVVVGGMDKITQAESLKRKPHIVVATPGRIKVLLEENRDLQPAFSRAKYLVLDEADRVLEVGFEEELGMIFKWLPKSRQTLLFSATITPNLQTLIELSANKAYFFEEYEGLKTVDTVTHKYICIPKNVKEVYLQYILSNLEEMGVRSAMVFVSTCRTCHLLNMMLDELDQDVVSLHSHKSQAQRNASLYSFKSGRIRILLGTDVVSRGLDIPTVDLVINYDIPRCAADYVHRVGRTARAGRGGMAISFIAQNDVNLILEIEDKIGHKLKEFEISENKALADISKVYKARRVATMKMNDDGFEEKVTERKKQNSKRRRDIATMQQMNDDGLEEKVTELKKQDSKRKKNKGAEKGGD